MKIIKCRASLLDILGFNGFTIAMYLWKGRGGRGKGKGEGERGVNGGDCGRKQLRETMV